MLENSQIDYTEFWNRLKFRQRQISEISLIDPKYNEEFQIINDLRAKLMELSTLDQKYKGELDPPVVLVTQDKKVINHV